MIDSVARPLRAWVTLKIAPPNVPDWVLALAGGFLPFAAASCAPPEPPGRAVVMASVPFRASTTVPDEIRAAPVSGRNCPFGPLMNTLPDTGLTSSLWPRTGGGGAGAWAVVNV